jgi:hypothetical protein
MGETGDQDATDPDGHRPDRIGVNIGVKGRETTASDGHGGSKYKVVMAFSGGDPPGLEPGTCGLKDGPDRCALDIAVYQNPMNAGDMSCDVCMRS